LDICTNEGRLLSLTAVGAVRITLHGPFHSIFKETEERGVDIHIPNPQCVLVLVNQPREEVWGEHNQHVSGGQSVDGTREKTEGPEAEGVQ
jgi:hypothetical protein